jgi:hypothetical protein
VKLPTLLRRLLGLPVPTRPMPKVGEVWQVWPGAEDQRIVYVQKMGFGLDVRVEDAHTGIWATRLHCNDWYRLNPPPVRVKAAEEQTPEGAKP